MLLLQQISSSKMKYYPKIIIAPWSKYTPVSYGPQYWQNYAFVK